DVKSNARSCYCTSIDQLWIVVDSHQSSPRALADQWSNVRFAEEPWHQVAPAAGELIDDHCLWTVNRSNRSREVLPFSRGPHIHEGTPHVVDNVIGCCSAAVEALIDHRTLFVDLREVIPVEIGVAAERRIGQVNISQAPGA